MQRFSRTHLSDPILLQSAAANAGRERTATADLLADLAEIDARKLYMPAGYASMFAFCVGELHLSEDAACKRITVARAARRFPAIFPAVASGRLHLSAVVLLAPHLVEENAESLLAAAAHMTKSEVEKLLAERFPASEVLAWVTPVPAAPVTPAAELSAPGRINRPPSPAPVESRPAAKPLSAQSFAVQFTMSQKGHEHLRYAQALLGHTVPSGDIAQVVERALAVYLAHLEKQKFAATSRPRRHGRPSANPRHIPARVKQAVWERDGGRCTFVSETGHRCEATRPLEFDQCHGGRARRRGDGRGDPAAVPGAQPACGGAHVRCRVHAPQADRRGGAAGGRCEGAR